MCTYIISRTGSSTVYMLFAMCIVHFVAEVSTLCV